MFHGWSKPTLCGTAESPCPSGRKPLASKSVLLQKNYKYTKEESSKWLLFNQACHMQQRDCIFCNKYCFRSPKRHNQVLTLVSLQRFFLCSITSTERPTWFACELWWKSKSFFFSVRSFTGRSGSRTGFDYVVRLRKRSSQYKTAVEMQDALHCNGLQGRDA